MLQLTKSERTAVLIILAIFMVSMLVHFIGPHQTRSDMYDYRMQDSLFKALSAQTAALPDSEIKASAEKMLKTKSSKKELRPKSININTAGESELVLLPRIGPATAKLILEYRRQNGPFKSIKELDNVKRIGPKTLKGIEPFIYIEGDSLP